MIKFFIGLIFTLVYSVSLGQSYPYLNSSTGNEGQFFTDKDTNIYMYHANQFEKVDKNFNLIWAKSYSGFNFRNALLSKKGSIYFIGKSVKKAGKYIGKLDASGNLIWVKALNGMTITVSALTQTVGIDCQQVGLDYQNNLLFTGVADCGGPKGFLIKTDTNGIILKFKLFDPPVVASSPYNYYGFNLLNDSAGNYKICTLSKGIPGSGIGLSNFNDLTDSIDYSFYSASPVPGVVSEYKFYKSKFWNNYYLMYSTNFSQDMCLIWKYNNVNTLWNRPISPYASNWASGLDEDEKGFVYATVSTDTSNFNFNAAYTKIDSSGGCNGWAYNYFNNYYLGSTYPLNPPMTKLNVIQHNNYYIDAVGPYLPYSPLTISIIDSTLLIPCISQLAIGTSAGNGMPFFSGGVPKTLGVSNYTLSSFSSSVVPIPLVVNPNFCIVMGVDNVNENSKEHLLYPNPSNDKIFFESEMEKVEVFDMNGRNLKSAINVSQLNISDLANGIYFIRIKTDKGEFNKKFIKD